MALFIPKVSLKVDLTENRDFSKQQDIRSIVISPEIMSSVISLRENDMMTNEEYFLISKYENIFGRKHVHINRAESIFNKEIKIVHNTIPSAIIPQSPKILNQVIKEKKQQLLQ